MAPPPTLLQLVCTDFSPALDLLRSLGARLDAIYPADDPHTAILTHDGAHIRLTSQPEAPRPSDVLPHFQPEFVLSHARSVAGEGRAGMRYRDLIPGRLGGRYIASHISIENGGPVADWVHFHRILFQLICVRRGTAKVVYQDQGEPFVIAPGDIVLQPPGIRHRVLENSPGLEVVEVTCPALHETFADHDMALPNSDARPSRSDGGQLFLHHRAETSPWNAWHGAEAQETEIGKATGGRGEARIIRPGAAPVIDVPPHDGELVFAFVLEGSVWLEHRDRQHELGPADSFVIPPGEAWRLQEASAELKLLHVTTAKFGGADAVG